MDPAAFRWTDGGWRGLESADLLLYELHVGTFSRAGTFDGVIGRLPALRDLGVEFYTPYTRILDTSRGIERPAWCVGGEMNVVHNCLDKWLDTPAADRDAVVYESEEGEAQSLTYRELHDQVAACAAGLRAHGIAAGDVVGLYMPMTPELVVAFLAASTAALFGATITSTGSSASSTALAGSWSARST